MADFTADFEAGSNGAAITTGGGEASATAWDLVSGTPTYSNAQAAHGTLSALAGSGTQLSWNLSSVSVEYGRVYLYVPSAMADYSSVIVSNNGGSQLQFFSTRQMSINQGASYTNLSTLHPLNAWFRLEWYIVHSATVGQWTVKLFLTPDSSTADETTSSPANLDTGASGTRIDIRAGSAFYIDDVVGNATTWPGPVPGAPQTLLASADSVDGSWTDDTGGTNLSGAIDETTASDTDYIQSELSPSASGCRVKLESGGDPASSSDHEIQWRAGKNATGGQTINMTVKLYQGGGNSLGGGTLIADFDRNAVDALTDYVETLSGGEADAITDYTDLYLEFHANAT
jgi:hypothetical protein